VLLSNATSVSMLHNRRVRATIALTLAALACFAVISFNGDESVTAAETVHSSADAWKPKEKGGVIRALVDLKAYCMGARHKAIKLQNKAKTSSLIPFIVAFSKYGNKDLVTEYAQTVGKLRAQFQTGLGAFLLDRMNENVLTGKKITMLAEKAPIKNYALLDHTRLGLRTRPDYFRTMAIRLSAWAGAKAKIHSGSGGDAIKAWIKSGNAEVFQMFRAKITSRYLRQRQIQDGKEEAGALVSEKAAFAEGVKKKHGNQQVMQPLPPAGAKGGKYIRDKSGFKFPSPKQIAKEAMKKTLDYMAKVAKRDATSQQVVRAIEAKLEGTTIRITTSRHPFSDSTIVPDIELQGDLASIKGKIEALPLEGETLEQTFTGDSLGQIQHVRLSIGKTNNPWLCSKFEVQVGTGNPWVIMTPDGFGGELPAKFWLDGAPYGHPPYFGLERKNVWLLRPAATAKPSYRKKYTRKWPHCTNIKCIHGDASVLEASCSSHRRCNGFSYSTGAKRGGWGCLKKKCQAGNDAVNGFGKKKFDYYEKFTDYWTKELKRRKERKAKAIEEKKVKKEKGAKEKVKKRELGVKEVAAKKNEKLDKAAKKKELSNKQEAKSKELQRKERSSKERKSKERRSKITCTVSYFKHNNYGTYLGSVQHYCGKKFFKFPRYLEDSVSSFKLTRGCNNIEVYDEDKCRQGYKDNRVYTSSTPGVTWDLNDDICGIRVDAKC